ncbi:MAG: MBL fold metallo-hydrolase [Micavibrio aeruginosavorus]|uniref:MBL fold metallo-hydrolase n=1 Tax=Micavibrio aeruginosavorus TaxID=349221 RepID=A0A7T5R0Q8_9BACT|nr:MAG: MBL fold metallo-hydrolase [Micavibrio aeruginosavorus]
MNLKVKVLGCGNSAGVPMIGNFWGQCDPEEPRNRRTRASLAIESEETTLVIDTGPDFKAQINRENIQRLNAVLYTHAHSDHLHGIDDLRVFRLRNKKVIPIYGDLKTIREIEERFSYLFVENGPDGLYPRAVEPIIIHPEFMGQPMVIGDIPVTPFVQSHGVAGTSLGFRFGDLAYSTDMTDLDQQALETISGIKTWIVDCNGYKMPANHVHATLKNVFVLNEIVQAAQVYLTHMPAFMDYKTVMNELPSGYAPAYDGLALEIDI